MAQGDDHIQDFLDNILFREWVMSPNDSLDAYWAQYLREHPGRAEALKDARELLLQIRNHAEADFPDDLKVDSMYAVISEQTGPPARNVLRKWRPALWAAASAAIILCAWFLAPGRRAHSVPAQYEHLVSSTNKPMKEYVNTTGERKILTLPDSSVIHLNPGSRLSHATGFACENLREVYLEGSAFFDIRPDPDRPFHVYSDELVTKVLGTSFWIHSCPEKDELVVEVVKGKVSVSTRDVHWPGGLTINRRELLLTPNQQVLFEKKHTSLKKALVPNPVMIRKPSFRGEFEFDDAPASEIFGSIEKTYGVELEYDKQRLGHCLLTASLTDETLYEMLDLLCTALNARYFVEETKIIITGNGCAGE